MRVSLVAPELQSHLRDEIREQAAACFADVQILQSEHITDAVVYIVTRPRHVAINEVVCPASMLTDARRGRRPGG